MRIVCAGCKSEYSLSLDEIGRLTHSILPCGKCGKFIKITPCPRCKAVYSITFSSPSQGRYRLTCQSCTESFIIEFPMIREARSADGPGTTGGAAKKKSRAFRLPSFLKRSAGPSKKRQSTAAPQISPSKNVVHPHFHERGTSVFTLQGFLSAWSGALAPMKLAIAAGSVMLSSIMLFSYNRLIALVFSTGDDTPAAFIKSAIHIAPFALLFFIYLAAATVIAMLTIDEAGPRSARSQGIAFGDLARSIGSVFIAAAALFISATFIFMLFGAIPIIGPLLFALLFLPLYAASLCVMIVFAVGFWFYPPIVAARGPGAAHRTMFSFIRRHGLVLAYAVPILSIVTAAASSVVLILHGAAVSIALFIARNSLAVIDSVPFMAETSPIFSFSDIFMAGSEPGLHGSLITAILTAETAAGVIIGIALSIISITLIAVLISLAATLSARAYIMLERGAGADDAGTVRLLLLSLLLLACILLVKKVFL